MTLNHSAVLLKKLGELKPKGGPDTGTNVGDAIALATIHLDSTTGAKRQENCLATLPHQDLLS